MTTDLATLNSVSEQVKFFQAEAFKAWHDMARFAFDIDPNSTQFSDAQERFNTATARCRKEMERLET